jgi:hypothetical protein
MNTNKIWMRLLMAGTLLALLFTTACGMENVMVNAIEGPAEQALAEQGDAYMTRLKDGDFQVIYEMMDSDAQRDLDKSISMAGRFVDVKSIIESVGSEITAWKFDGARIFTKNGVIRGTLKGRVEYVDGTSGKVTLGFEVQDGAWKVRTSNWTMK